jgi:hypothetical protein
MTDITSLRKTHLFRGHIIVAVSTARLADGYPWTEIKPVLQACFKWRRFSTSPHDPHLDLS